MTYVGTALPLYMIGDCHTLAHADLLYEDRGTRYVTRGKFCRGLYAQNFTDADGNVFPPFVEALVSELLVTRTPAGLVANHRVVDNDTVPEGIARERTRVAPVLCVFAGDFDLRTVFLPGFQTLDFELPDDEASGTEAAPATAGERVPYRVARTYAARLLEPLFTGLRTLAALGFKNLYVHSLPPPTVDDAAFEALHGFRVPVAVRYKASRLFNSLLAEFARQNPAVRFVDMWAATTVANRLDPAFALDGLHLNRRAAALTVERILTDLAGRSGLHDPERYRDAARTARAAASAHPVARPDVRDRFAREGIVRIDLGPARAAHLRSLVRADLHGTEAPAEGWAYDPLEPNLTFSAYPTDELLRELAGLLADVEIAAILGACCGYLPAILNVRVFRSLAHEGRLEGPRAVQFAPLPFPPDVVRGVVYLDDVDNLAAGPLVIRAAGGTGMVGGTAGTLLLFDPHRIDVLPPERPPERANNLDLLFGPPAPDVQIRVIAAGRNALWPLDPANPILAGTLVAEIRS